jgi:uncharacterized protein YcbK (DUF882 family)
MKLPNGNLVYSNTRIIDSIPLTWGEMTKNCSRVPTTQELVDNAIKLTKVWGEVREKWGDELIITSGFRPPQVNRSVGGASQSQHLFFRAVDMYPANGRLNELWGLVNRDSRFSGLGDGRKRGFIHCDIRPGSRLVFDY